jgi:RNA polymerase sigma factor for flagellar operon FliA
MALDEHALEEAWKAVYDLKDPSCRAKLIEHYQPFADRLATAMHRNVPPSVELGDLKSLAYVGLIKCVDRFNPNINDSFELFSAATIRGHMLDDLRARDRVSRSTRRTHKEIEAARAALEAALSRPPSLEEISTESGITLSQIRDTIAKVDASRAVSIDEAPTSTPPSPPPDATIPRLQAEMGLLIRGMPLKMQQLLALKYYQKKTLGEAATALGLTPSQASDLHAKAVLAIRDLAIRHLDTP